MAFWIALAVLLVAVVGGHRVRGRSRLPALSHREAESAPHSAARWIGSAASREQIERHAAAAEAAAGRLKDASGRLATSRARLDVQLAAVREARAQVRRVFWFVPGV